MTTPNVSLNNNITTTNLPPPQPAPMPLPPELLTNIIEHIGAVGSMRTDTHFKAAGEAALSSFWQKNESELMKNRRISDEVGYFKKTNRATRKAISGHKIIKMLGSSLHREISVRNPTYPEDVLVLDFPNRTLKVDLYKEAADRLGFAQLGEGSAPEGISRSAPSLDYLISIDHLTAPQPWPSLSDLPPEILTNIVKRVGAVGSIGTDTHLKAAAETAMTDFWQENEERLMRNPRISAQMNYFKQIIGDQAWQTLSGHKKLTMLGSAMHQELHARNPEAANALDFHNRTLDVTLYEDAASTLRYARTGENTLEVISLLLAKPAIVKFLPQTRNMSYGNFEHFLSNTHNTQHITHLDLSGLKLTRLPRVISEFFTNLKDLNLDDNRLQKMPSFVEDPWYLKTLSLNRNSIKTLEGELPSRLQSLSVGGNQIQSLRATLPTGLEKLYLGGNSIKSLEGAETLPRSLRDLYLNENPISSLQGINGLPPSLEGLCLNETEIVSFAVEGENPFPRLQSLSLNDNSIGRFNGANLLRLQTLFLNGNSSPLTEVTFPPQLKTLFLNRARITSLANIAIHCPQSLRSLYLRETGVSKTDIRNAGLPRGLQVNL